MISGPSHAEINELCLLNTFIGRFLCLISSICDERFLRNPDYAPDGTKTLFLENDVDVEFTFSVICEVC